jgi:hypothetical protein
MTVFKGKKGSFEFHVQATKTEFLFMVSGPAEHRLFARQRQPGEHLYKAFEILKQEGYWFE